MNLVKSTLWASVVYTVPPLSFLWLGWLEMHSPEWGTDDSGAVQGYAIFALSSITALLCVIVVFPSIAKLLGATFTSRKWVYLNMAVIALMAFIASIMFGYTAGYSSFTGIFVNAVVLSIPLTIICLVLLAPAMYVWLRIAIASHNKARQNRPAGWTR